MRNEAGTSFEFDLRRNQFVTKSFVSCLEYEPKVVEDEKKAGEGEKKAGEVEQKVDEAEKEARRMLCKR